MRNGQTAKTATGAVLEKTFAEDTAKFGGNNVADTVAAATTRARNMISIQPDKTGHSRAYANKGSRMF